MKRKLGSGLQRRMTEMKQNTANKVRHAIEEMLEEGLSKREIKRKDILARTGLSNGTLSQDHVKEVLEEFGVCQYYVKKTVETEHKETGKKKSVNELLIENHKLKSKIEDYELLIESYKDKLEQLGKTNIEYAEKIQLLRGKLQAAFEVINIMDPDQLKRFNLI